MSKIARMLFVALAPLTVPLQFLYLALSSLVAGSYYLTVELTLSPMLKRPVRLSPIAYVLTAPLMIVLMPPAVLAHVLIWVVRQAAIGVAALGQWQANATHRAAAMVLGFVWLVAAAWSLVVCIDAQAGLWLLGREVPGAATFDLAMRKRMTLGELSRRFPDVADRRRALLDSLTNGVNSRLASAGVLRDEIGADDTRFEWLRRPIQARLVGLPWYYQSATQSVDGIAHCEFFVGPLLLAILLLIRWPGMHAGTRSSVLPLLMYLLRVGGVLYAIGVALTWMPMELVIPTDHFDATWFRCISPAVWLGFDPSAYLPPEWWSFNAALWLLLAGLGVLLWWIAWALRFAIGAPGYYTTFLAIRLLQRKRIAFFSIGAVTLCVAMELIVISVMGGFLDTIRSRAHAVVGDLVMDAGLTGFPYYQEFIDRIEQWEEVDRATPVIQSYGILRYPNTNRTRAVEVRGLRLDEYREVLGLGGEDSLFYDRYYPGTTRFDPAGQPFFGVDPATRKPILPEPFESAWKRYLGSLSPDRRAAVEDQWERLPDTWFSGPGIFEPNPDIFERGGVAEPIWKGRELPGIIVGRDLIAARQPSGEYERGDEYPRGFAVQLSLLPMSRRGRLTTEFESPPAPYFRYVDDMRTGVYEIDSRRAYVDFELLQDLLSMSPQKRADGTGMTPPRCSLIQIRLAPRADLRQMKSRIQEAWDLFSMDQPGDADDQAAMRNVVVSDWEFLQRDFIAAIQKEKVLVVIMFGIISLVAVLLVLCIFYMIVVEKTRDIGIIKSLGGSAQGVAAVFLIYGAAIGVVGATLGSIIGAVFVRYINEVQDWLARLNPEWRIWSPQTYSFDRIPDTVKLDEMLWIAGLAILAAIVGAVAPALRAARTWPVEALRYE